MLRALVARKDGKRCNSVSAASGDDLVRHVGGTLLDGAARQAEPYGMLRALAGRLKSVTFAGTGVGAGNLFTVLPPAGGSGSAVPASTAGSTAGTPRSMPPPTTVPSPPASSEENLSPYEKQRATTIEVR